MSLSIASSGWQQLFASSPDSEQGSKAFVNYVSSSDGAWTCFSVVDSLLSYVQLFCPLSASRYALIGRVSQSIAVVGGALSVPACLVAGFQVYRQVERAGCSASGLRWQETAKKIFLKSMDLINNLTFLPDVLNQLCSSRFTSEQQCFVDGVYYASSLVLEGNAISSFDPLQLPWMSTAKSVLSVAISLISLGGLIYGIPLGGAGSCAITLLHLNSLWLALKISTHLDQSQPIA